MTIKEYPQNWRDLQIKVGEILEQSGFKVEIEKNLNGARIEVEIDVYATECIDNRNYKIICECKHWNSNIPQNVVHSLHTVASDLGINKAYLITTSEFQSGALNSTKNTLIELLTWESFQETFFKSWYLNFFSYKLSNIIKNNYNPTAISFFEDFELIEKSEFRKLISQYDALNDISNHFPSAYLKSVPKYFDELNNLLPLCEKLDENIRSNWEMTNVELPKNILEETNYCKFLNEIEIFCIPIYKKLDKLNLYLDDED
jgi:hypothetical protein